MNYKIISSSSKGNAILIEDIFLLDCGLPYSKIKPYLKDVRLIFITHRHNDHLNKNTIHAIAYNKPNIKFLVGEYLVKTLINCEVQRKNIITIKENVRYNLNLCRVMIQPLDHDVENCCLHLEYEGKKLIYIVDTGSIPENIVAKNYDLYLIEGNYATEEELDEKIRIAKEQGIFTHYERVKYTHLSQVQAINFLNENMGDNGKYEFIHIHREAINEK